MRISSPEWAVLIIMTFIANFINCMGAHARGTGLVCGCYGDQQVHFSGNITDSNWLCNVVKWRVHHVACNVAKHLLFMDFADLNINT